MFTPLTWILCLHLHDWWWSQTKMEMKNYIQLIYWKSLHQNTSTLHGRRYFILYYTCCCIYRSGRTPEPFVQVAFVLSSSMLIAATLPSFTTMAYLKYRKQLLKVSSVYSKSLLKGNLNNKNTSISKSLI